jgi:hypothetical protein
MKKIITILVCLAIGSSLSFAESCGAGKCSGKKSESAECSKEKEGCSKEKSDCSGDNKESSDESPSST